MAAKKLAKLGNGIALGKPGKCLLEGWHGRPSKEQGTEALEKWGGGFHGGIIEPPIPISVTFNTQNGFFTQRHKTVKFRKKTAHLIHPKSPLS
jgi:hypothetical protein